MDSRESVILKESEGENVSFPPVVVHCFTGTKEEALTYIDRDYYIGFTGTICMFKRGKHLRDMLPELPLNKLMIETDAPFMGFRKDRKGSEPVDCLDVARKLSETVNVPLASVCRITFENSMNFFLAPKSGGGKSKSALKRERQKLAKQKKEAATAEEMKRKAEEEKQRLQEAAKDPEKRAKKLKKVLRAIIDLKGKDYTTLNDDQKKKVATEEAVRKELAELGV